MTLKRLLAISLVFISFCACKKKVEDSSKIAPPVDGTYWSVIDFAKDQWQTYHGQPFSLQRIVTTNGKVDSSYMSAYDVDWGTIFQTFFVSDISDKKLIGHYNFSSFDEDYTHTHTFYYEAKDPDLFTRKLQISIDPTSNRIVSIFIETQKSSRYDGSSTKLYYSPMKVIQIQSFDKSKTGDPVQTVTEYRFLN